MKTKEPVAVLENELGTVAFQEAVFTTLVQESISEMDGVLDIRLNQLFGKQRGQKITITTGEASDEVSLHVSVRLRGPVNVLETGAQIQARIISDLSKCLGVVVKEVVVAIEDIIY